MRVNGRFKYVIIIIIVIFLRYFFIIILIIDFSFFLRFLWLSFSDSTENVCVQLGDHVLYISLAGSF